MARRYRYKGNRSGKNFYRGKIIRCEVGRISGFESRSRRTRGSKKEGERSGISSIRREGGRFATVSQPLFFAFSPNGGGWKRITAIKRKGRRGEEEGRRIGEDGSEPAKLPELSMHPIMEMRPLAALENYVDVMRDTPFFVHPTRPPPPPPRLSPLPSPLLSLPPELQLENSFRLISNS